MLRYAIMFLVIAIVAAIFGFRQLSGLSADIAKFCVVVFVILAIISFFFGRRPKE